MRRVSGATGKAWCCKAMSEGVVVYYQDDDAPRDHAWRWKFVSGTTVISSSDQTFKTRRGAMDDWNRVQSVVKRLEKGAQ